MPIDVLIEVKFSRAQSFPIRSYYHEQILRHLKPIDLLHLSRTSKVFRAFLMSRASTHFWRTARANIEGLPDCPEDLSEPAYAHLAFDSRCHVSLFLSYRIFTCLRCSRDVQNRGRRLCCGSYVCDTAQVAELRSAWQQICDDPCWFVSHQSLVKCSFHHDDIFLNLCSDLPIPLTYGIFFFGMVWHP